MVIFHRYVSYQRVTAKMMEKLKTPKLSITQHKTGQKNRPVHKTCPSATADLERDVRASAGLCEVGLVSKHLSMWDATSGVKHIIPK